MIGNFILVILPHTHVCACCPRVHKCQLLPQFHFNTCLSYLIVLCGGEFASSSTLYVDNLNSCILMESDPSMNPKRGVGSLSSFGNHVTVA